MSLQPMEIADTLARGSAIRMKNDDGDTYEKPSRLVTGLLATAKRVQLPALSPEGMRAGALDAERLGPQRLPFHTMWLERSLVLKNGNQQHFGALVFSPESFNSTFSDFGGPYAESDNGYGLLFFSKEPGGFVETVPITIELTVENCAITGVAGMHMHKLEEIDTRSAGGSDLVHLAMIFAEGIGLMNCKNVSLEPVTSKRFTKQARKGRRKRKPKIDYHTIVLPGLPGAGGSNQGSGQPMPLHTVRGHFKTYTKDRPLMGKFTGTYWFAAHVRGDAKHGATVTDYRVEA